MVTTQIINGNVYVASLSDNQGASTGSIGDDTIENVANKTVEIHSARIEYTYLNELKDRTFKSGGETDDTKPIRVTDLKRIRKVIIVTGVLVDDESESATIKRDNLLTMGEFNRALSLVWGNGNYRTLFTPNLVNDQFGVFIAKQIFKETAGLIGANVLNDPQPFRKINIEMQFIVGLDIVLPQ